MGHVFTRKDSDAYAKWRSKVPPHDPLILGRQILSELLAPRRRDSILEIGCGVGEVLEYCLSLNMETTGIDPSHAMLDYAVKRVGNRSSLYECYAEDLPFDDNSFHYACFFTSLEFVQNPEKALEEACRVAKDKVFIGLVNPYALKGLTSRVQALWGQGMYARARFFTLWEIKIMVRKLLGDVPVFWRSIGLLPAGIPGSHFLDTWSFAQRLPFGSFIGISVVLVPRFRLKTLALPYPEKNPYPNELRGLAAEAKESLMQSRPESD